MNCPRCGASQPFDLKCVKCDADIGATLKSEKTRLRLYRSAVVVFFLLIVWLAADDLLPKRTPPLLTIQVPQTERVLPPATAEGGRVITPLEGREVRPAGVVAAILQKTDLEQYRALNALRAHYPGEVRVTDLRDDLPALEELGNGALVAIGPEAAASATARGYDLPLILLSNAETTASLTNPRERIYAVQPLLPADLELSIMHHLFEGMRSMVLIIPEAAKKPSPGLVRDFDLRLVVLPPDPVAIDRELARTEEPPPLVWLHRLSKDEKTAVLGLRSLENLIVAAGLAPTEEASGKKTSATLASPFLELRVSSEGMGSQGALILRKLLNGMDVDEMDLYPKAALEVHLHLQRALALSREDLLENLRARARRSAYQVTLVP